MAARLSAGLNGRAIVLVPFGNHVGWCVCPYALLTRSLSDREAGWQPSHWRGRSSLHSAARWPGVHVPARLAGPPDTPAEMCLPPYGQTSRRPDHRPAAWKTYMACSNDHTRGRLACETAARCTAPCKNAVICGALYIH